MRVEASHFIKTDINAKIPYLGRHGSKAFVNALYKSGAISVEIANSDYSAQGSNFIMGLYVRLPPSAAQIRSILIMTLDTYPAVLVEEKPQILKVKWTFAHCHAMTGKHGLPNWSRDYGSFGH